MIVQQQQKTPNSKQQTIANLTKQQQQMENTQATYASLTNTMPHVIEVNGRFLKEFYYHIKLYILLCSPKKR
jgi:CRISPR/Cas system CMR-associated protein Cmr5 small subunit